MDTIVYSIEWKRNPDVDVQMVLQSFYFHLKSALTEELVFRGALLYILIQRLGIKKGIAISSIVFGVYHWFTYGMFGSIVPMMYIFIITGAMGLVWAISFAKTASLFLALGLHLGINFLSALFSRSPTGSLIWIESSRIELSEWTNLFYLLAKGLTVPILCFFFIQYLSNYFSKSNIIASLNLTMHDKSVGRLNGIDFNLESFIRRQCYFGLIKKYFW